MARLHRQNDVETHNYASLHAKLFLFRLVRRSLYQPNSRKEKYQADNTYNDKCCDICIVLDDVYPGINEADNS